MPFGAILGAVVPALVGGLVNRKEAKDAARAVHAQNAQQRAWEDENYTRDRRNYLDDVAASNRRDDDVWLRNRRAAAADLDQQVESRGIDFAKLRDQAQAAGFNPLSVLGNAGAYSTERGLGALTGGGGGGASFAASGRGFTAASAPVMSSGSFIQEALERGIDTVFNRPAPSDPLADALRAAQEQGEAQRQAETRQIPRSFGYDLTEERAFSPAVVSGIPDMSAAEQERVTMPTGQLQVGGRNMIPIRTPDGLPGNIDASVARRLDLEPFDLVSAGDWAEIVGEVGEIETAVFNQQVRRAALGRGIASAPANARAGGKKTKPPKMHDPNPRGGWMDEFFR